MLLLNLKSIFYQTVSPLPEAQIGSQCILGEPKRKALRGEGEEVCTCVKGERGQVN